jgi:transcriptional regulator with XRE-family HTH domain
MNFLPKRLIELRTQLNYSVRDLAEASGVSKSSISAYEKGERNPKQEPLENLARALRCDVDYLTGKSNTPLSLESIESVLGKLSTKELELFMSLRNLSTEEYEKKMDEIILFIDNQ